MKLSLFNTLTRKKEIFTPLNENLITMYVCGPTVYDHPHIGNARSAVVYDVLYRILIQLFTKHKVRYVRNITDIDDKIIDRAKQDNVSINELTEKTTKLFHSNMEYLGCLPPTIEPRATQHVQDMIEIINRLLLKNIAYEAAGHVYFDVAKFPDYSQLSGQNSEELTDSVRKEQSEGKRNLNDFVLWKPAKKDDDKSVIFASPFGMGRPGWHIECSAMSHKFLGSSFDIHGGGVDLVFPHHTNEIAQSRCAFEGSQYAKFWVHNGFLTINHEKMSKSTGNFLTVEDIMNRGIKGDVLRLFLLNAHYRKPLDYNDKAIKDANHTLNYWYRAIKGLAVPQESDIIPREFLSALFDDINTHNAIKIINDYAKNCYTATDNATKLSNATKLINSAKFLGLFRESDKEWFAAEVDASKVEQLIEERKLAKQAKNWALADNIRIELNNMGIAIQDHANGSISWEKKI